MMLADKQDAIWKDLGKCVFGISLANNDWTAKEQEHSSVPKIVESKFVVFGVILWILI